MQKVLLIDVAILIVIVLFLIWYVRKEKKKDNYCGGGACVTGLPCNQKPMSLTACRTCNNWDPAALAELKGLDDLSVYGSDARANKALNMALEKAQTVSRY